MPGIAQFEELKASVVRSILVRRITLGVFSAIALAGVFIVRLSYRSPLVYAPVAWFLLTFPFKVLIERQRTERAFHWIHFGFFAAEVFLITVMVHWMGGSEWVGSVFYLFSVIYANFFLPRLHGGLLTGLVVALYAGLVLLEYAGVIPHRSLFVLSGPPYRNLFYNAVTILAGVAGVYAVVAFTVRMFTAVYLRSNRLLAQRERQLARMSRRLLIAHDDERRRVARELHDGLIQSLAAVKLHLASTSHNAEFGDRDARTTEIIDRAIAETRTLAYSLRPPLLDDLGLVASLHRLGENLQEDADLDIEVRSELSDRLEVSIESLLYHVAHQTLENVVRHARARRADVELVRSPHGITLSVVDDGIGFRPDDPQGLGLRGIRERVEVCGGRMTIDSAPGHGARVTVEVPFDGASNLDR